MEQSREGEEPGEAARELWVVWRVVHCRILQGRTLVCEWVFCVDIIVLYPNVGPFLVLDRRETGESCPSRASQAMEEGLDLLFLLLISL